MTASILKSILAVECGSTTTTAVLIERTGPNYHLVATGQAPSTYDSPWKDITLGVQEAIRHIALTVERPLLSPGGWPITPQSPGGQGVDAFVVVSSAGEPLQVMLAGLTQDISLASAQRAATGTYCRIAGTISLNADDGNQNNNQIPAIREAGPEVILLTGGTNGGAKQPVLDMGQLISIGLQLIDKNQPTILFAGNDELRPQMADILGTITALKSVNNVRPLVDIEDLVPAQTKLEQIYIQEKMLQLPGFDKLKNWSQYEVAPACRSFEKLIGFMGQHNNLNVLGANVGSKSTVIATQYRDELNSTIRSDVGLGQSLASLLEQVPMEQIHRWLPFELTEDGLRHHLLNKSLYPNTIPTSPEDLMIEHAVAREALRLVIEQEQAGKPERQWNMVIGTGGALTGAPHAAHAAMVLLDGIEPWGVTTLKLDKSGVVTMLGSIAVVEPVAAVQLVQQDAFINLGTIVAPAGHGHPGQTAMKVIITRANGDVEENDVLFGSLQMVWLPEKEKVKLEIRPARQFDIGLGQPGRGAIAEVEGGLLGIILDARGRPLKLPKDKTQRQEQLQQWLKGLNVSYAPPVN